MKMTTRAAAAVGIGLALALVVGLITRSSTAQQTDRAVQRTDTGQTANGTSTNSMAVLNLEQVINQYDRYNESSDRFKAEAQKKQAELNLMLEEVKRIAEEQSAMKVGTPDFQRLSDQFTDAKARYEAEQQKAYSDLSIRESSTVAEIYNDIRYVVDWLAKRRGLSMVIQAGSNDRITGEDPDSVAVAVSRNVIWHDAQIDITNDVIDVLNRMYTQAKQGNANPAPPAGN